MVAPKPRRGLLALLDQPTFDIRSLPPLPRGLTGFTVLSIDPLKTYDQILALVRTSNPQAADQVPAFEAAVRQQLGVDLRRDLLAHLGPKLSFYSQPPAPEVAGNPAAAMMAAYTGLTISAQVRGAVALRRVSVRHVGVRAPGLP